MCIILQILKRNIQNYFFDSFLALLGKFQKLLRKERQSFLFFVRIFYKPSRRDFSSGNLYFSFCWTGFWESSSLLFFAYFSSCILSLKLFLINEVDNIAKMEEKNERKIVPWIPGTRRIYWKARSKAAFLTCRSNLILIYEIKYQMYWHWNNNIIQ